MTETGFLGHEWFAEFFVRDLEEIADKLRQTADFIDGKAALLHEQMVLAATVSGAVSGAEMEPLEKT